MGAITYKFSKACELGVKCLFDIFNHGESFIVNQAIILMRDLLRKYRNSKSFELLKIINIEFTKKINLPESKSALLFILGEFADKIKQSVEILNWFSGNFPQENEKVKAQILNAAIKNFVLKPNESEELTKYVLEKAGEECENPDIRDRAYIYWRLLENDPDSAKEMLLGAKPDFLYKDEEMFDKSLLDDLVENLTNISCLYQKKSSEMLASEDLIIENQNNETEIEVDEENKEEKTKQNSDKLENIKESGKRKKKNKIIETKINTNDFDLLGLGESSNTFVTTNSNPNILNLDIMDIFGVGNSINSNNINNINNSSKIKTTSNILNQDALGATNNIINNSTNKQKIEDSSFAHSISNFSSNNNNINDVFSDIQFLEDDENSENNIFSNKNGVSQPKPYKALDKEQRGKNGIYGLFVSGLFHRENQSLFLGLHLKNFFHLGMNEFSFVLRKNIFGLNISDENQKSIQEFYLNSENNKNLILKLNIDPYNMLTFNTNEQYKSITNPMMIDLFIKNNLEDFSLKFPIYLNCLNSENGKMTNQNFMEYFKKYSENKFPVNYSDDLKSEILKEETLAKTLEKNNVFMIAKNNKLDPPVFFYSGLVQNNIPYILEISFNKSKLKIIQIITYLFNNKFCRSTQGNTCKNNFRNSVGHTIT